MSARDPRNVLNHSLLVEYSRAVGLVVVLNVGEGRTPVLGDLLHGCFDDLQSRLVYVLLLGQDPRGRCTEHSS